MSECERGTSHKPRRKRRERGTKTQRDGEKRNATERQGDADGGRDGKTRKGGEREIDGKEKR